MDTLATPLLLAAAGLGLTHTLLGPDHYLPFVMLSRARGWSLGRTLGVAAICGVGHVGSSLLLASVGLALGWATGQLESVEAQRGDWAAWLLLLFGLAYAAWGLRVALTRGRGAVPHAHDGHVHLHLHGAAPHDHDHDHAHDGAEAGISVSFWTLFLVFVLGPCEPLIPLFAVPASRGSWGDAALCAAIFSAVTVTTMLAATAVGTLGVARLPLGRLERWAHAMAGSVVAASGAAILWLGL